MIGIYKITNKVNNKCYIGCSKSIKDRWTAHKNDSHNPNDKCYNTKFYRALRKYGIDNFNFEVLEECSVDLLFKKEIEYIQSFNSTNDEYGYNTSIGGDASGIDNSGEKHANSKMKEKEIIEIRELYNTCTLDIFQAFEIYKDRINWSGFRKIWNGYTWKKVHMHVYTESNKAYHKNKSLSRSGENNRSSVLNEHDIRQIRLRRNNGEERLKVFDDYSDRIKIKGFYSIWNDKTWKNIQP